MENFYGKLHFDGESPTGGDLYFFERFDFENAASHLSACGFPVKKVLLSKENYFSELKKGWGHSWGISLDGPISSWEIAWEAQRIIHLLHTCRGPGICGWNKREYYSIEISPSFLNRATEEQINALRDEFPHHGVEFGWEIYAEPGNKRRVFGFPKDQKEALEGVGLAENQKRYRGPDGQLELPIEDVVQNTQEEGLRYFQPGRQYLVEGMLFTYVKQDDSCLFTNGIYNLFVNDSRIGTFLPDVASCGREDVAVKDKRYLPLCLPKSLRKYVESMRNQ